MTMNEKIVFVNDVEWRLYEIDYDYLMGLSDAGHHISDWVWRYAKYEAVRMDTREEFFLSHFYKRDIKEIMAA